MRALIGMGLGILLLHGSVAGAAENGVIRVGSKSFTESYILAEIAAQVIERVGEARAERRHGLGGTGITYRAIASGAIDLYPEYTGTLARIILKDSALHTPEAIRARLLASGLTMSEPLGFSNTYALAVRAETAERRGLRRISDLARHPELKAAFSSGFLEREDGWPGLTRHYGLALREVRVMEHALTYRAIVSGDVDLMDVFSTDGQLERLRLQILLDGKRVAEVAAAFLGTASPDPRRPPGVLSEISALTLDHLVLVLISLAAAVVLGIPMGIAAARFRRTGQIELGVIGMLQTVPALALLVFMIPLFGIGKGPALVALSLYALLPVVRSTYAGLIAIDGHLLDIAFVLGLGRLRRLVRIELPLASISIMAGIKTAAVMTVGTATLAAFIGGRGYGTLIVRGLALDDTATILAGAAPAAAMAVAFHVAFELLDRLAVPRGLRR